MTAKKKSTSDQLTNGVLDELLLGFQNRTAHRPRPDKSVAEDQLPNAAAAVVSELLTKLDWSIKQLGERSGVASSQLSEWLSGRRIRLGADELARIAWAIVGQFDGAFGSSGRESGTAARSRLDHLLALLFRLGGYSPGSNSYEDVIWRREFDGEDRDERLLTVGWFAWPPLSGPLEPFEGPAENITAKVAALLGKGARFEFIRFQDAENAIRTRSVDLIAPMMTILPGRYTAYRFSQPIPEIGLETCLLVPTAKLHTVRAEGSEIREDRIELVLPRREIAATVADLVYPKALRSQLKSDSDIPSHNLADQIAAEPTGKHDLVRVLITSRLTAAAVQKRHPSTFTLLRPQLLRSYVFRVGFALHPDELRLLDAINAAISFLTESGTFRRMLVDDPTTKSRLKAGGITFTSEPSDGNSEEHDEAD